MYFSTVSGSPHTSAEWIFRFVEHNKLLTSQIRSSWAMCYSALREFRNSKMPSPSRKNASARQVDKFRKLARTVVEHHFGSKPALIKYKSGGLSNYVFEAKHSEGSFIVRISPDKSGLNAFIKEHWCERAARRAGIPTAEILETGTSLIPFPYVIARSVSGVSAEKHPERAAVFREMGKM